MARWKLKDAKARFSELLQSALEKGPQFVIHQGREAAVLVAIEDWNRLQRIVRSDLKSLLLEAEPRF
jgi:prevent-host-death family protein